MILYNEVGEDDDDDDDIISDLLLRAQHETIQTHRV